MIDTSWIHETRAAKLHKAFSAELHATRGTVPAFTLWEAASAGGYFRDALRAAAERHHTGRRTPGEPWALKMAVRSWREIRRINGKPRGTT